MSYSFTVRAASKAAALVAVAEKFAEVVKHQPSHAIDEPQVKAVTEAVVGLLVDDSERDVSVSVSGSIGTAVVSDDAPPFVTHISINAGANLVARVPVEG